MMRHAFRLFFVSVFLLRSILAERATAFFVVVATILLLVSFSLGNIDIAVRFKLLEDVLFASQTFLLTLCALFYPFSLMEKERKGGIFTLIMASGVSRVVYLGAQFLTLLLLLCGVFLFFLAIDSIFLSLLMHRFDILFFEKLSLSFLASALVAFVYLSLSRFVSNMNAILYTLFLFFIGNSLDTLLLFVNTKHDDTLSFISHVAYALLPNFSLFSEYISLAHNANILLFCTGYMFLYGGVLFCISLWRFFRENLRVT